MDDERQTGGDLQDDIRFITLLDTALRLSEEQRRTFLQTACADDPALLDSLTVQVEWEDRMGDFLLEPFLRRRTIDDYFQSGELAAERFRIVREAGRGAMGVIYEAADQRTGQRRALKCARPGFQQRLTPEACAAMRVTHDNICRVYEIHTTQTTQGPVDLLAMEYVEGETLTARLQRTGPLSSAEALHVLKQLCQGLAAAHKQNLLHRDLKTNNVMCTADRRAVIMDFGLARDLTVESDLSLSSELRGAPSYVAPELWKGSKASVQSDLYALGSIAYEMITGEHPFPDSASMEQRLRQAPAAPSSRKPGLDTIWDRLLLRCLDPDPAKRFTSVSELLEKLEPRSRKPIWLSLAGAVGVALLAYYAPHATVIPPLPTVRLAVLPLQADGCDGAPINGALYDVSDRLQRLRGLVTISLSESIAKKVTSAAGAGSQLGATHVLHTNVRCTSGAIQVQAEVMDARSAVAVRRLAASYPSDSLSRISTALIGEVTAAFRLKTDSPPDGVSAQAYSAYAQAVYLNRHDKLSSDKSIPLFQEAARLDTKSALPLTGLTEAYLSKYRATNDRQWLAKARESLHDAESRKPDSAAVHFESGGLSRATGANDQAAESYRRVLQLEPWNGDAWNHLAITYGAMPGRQSDAAQAFAKAIELEPGYFEPHVDFGVFYFRNGDYSQAAAQFQAAIELAPGNAPSHSSLCGIYEVMGRSNEAESECRQALALSPAAPAHNNLGAILAYHGRDSEAVAEYRKAIELEPNKYVYFQNKGDSLRRLKRVAESQTDYRLGREVAYNTLREDPASANARSFAGYFAVRLGDLKTGTNEMEQALRMAPDNVPVLRNAVLAYEALRQRGRSLSLLRNAPHTLLNELDRHPDLADLHRDLNFIKLLQK